MTIKTQIKNISTGNVIPNVTVEWVPTTEDVLTYNNQFQDPSDIMAFLCGVELEFTVEGERVKPRNKVTLDRLNKRFVKELGVVFEEIK